MMPRDIAARIATRLAAAGIEDARAEAWLLLSVALGRSRAELMAGAGAIPDAAQAARLEELVQRRAAREPIAYLLGEKEFWSLEFEVGPAVLIPRPETETVVEAVLDHAAERKAAMRLLDLGTGSGCLLLALLSELPNAIGLGIDDSPAALAIAGRNAARLDLRARAQFAQGRWGEGVDGAFDVIVSNPPYVAESEWPDLQPEIRGFEPKAALVAGPDGLAAYRALAPDCARLLAGGGLCALEIGYGQGDAVAAILSDHGLTVLARCRDLAGIERCLVARRAAGTLSAGRLAKATPAGDVFGGLVSTGARGGCGPSGLDPCGKAASSQAPGGLCLGAARAARRRRPARGRALGQVGPCDRLRGDPRVLLLDRIPMRSPSLGLRYRFAHRVTSALVPGAGAAIRTRTTLGVSVASSTAPGRGPLGAWP